MDDPNESRPVDQPDGLHSSQIQDTFSVPGGLTEDQTKALIVAHRLVDAGVPVFVAKPNHGKGPEFFWPKGWQETRPSHKAVETWRPGDALCAVGGHAVDFLDADPRHGADAAVSEIRAAGQWPRTFGTARTPSGGTHDLISATGENSRDGFMPGLDLKAGASNGEGRGFVYIAPTVRVAKDGPDKGRPVAYRWEAEPDLDLLAEFGPGADSSTEGIVARVQAARSRKTKPTTQTAAASGTADGLDPWDDVLDVCADFRADEVIRKQLERVRIAQAGEINSTLGGAARAIGRFVAAGHLDENEAVTRLREALDAGGVHSDSWNVANGKSWTAATVIAAGLANGREDFQGAPFEIVTGQEAVMVAHHNPAEDPRTARELVDFHREHAARRRAAFADSFLDLDALAAMPPAEPLIRDVLDLESATWLIGQPKGFKSFVALDWACHVAAERPDWRGHTVTAGDVLYVAGEGARGVAKRVRAWMAKHGVKPHRLRVRPLPVKVRGESRGAWSTDWQSLMDYATESRPALIVLDTQARMTVGMEENSATEMGVWNEAVETLKLRTGACVLVVHHTGRNGGDARGSSALDGAQDAEWKVERKPHHLEVTLRREENKDGNDTGRYRIALEVVQLDTDAEGFPITSLVLGDALDDAKGREGTEVLSAIAEEAESWSNQDWIVRTLAGTATEGLGIAKTTLLTLINEARKLAEPSLQPMNRNTYFSAIKRLVEAGQIEAKGAHLLPAPEPFD